MNVPWSQVQDTELARMARQLIWYNYDCYELDYHNWDHVLSMYQYLADTNEPYNEALDWAVLFHDIVYDEKPEKEFRSAKVFEDMASRYFGCTPDIWEQARIMSMINCTAKHVVELSDHSAIIRADLHSLTDKNLAVSNFNKIMNESMKLYNITDKEFAKSSTEFMEQLKLRIHKNWKNDPNYRDFYAKVEDGIRIIIELSKAIQGK